MKLRYKQLAVGGGKSTIVNFTCFGNHMTIFYFTFLIILSLSKARRCRQDQVDTRKLGATINGTTAMQCLMNGQCDVTHCKVLKHKCNAFLSCDFIRYITTLWVLDWCVEMVYIVQSWFLFIIFTLLPIFLYLLFRLNYIPISLLSCCSLSFIMFLHEHIGAKV